MNRKLIGLASAGAAVALSLAFAVSIPGGGRASAQTPDPTSTNTPAPTATATATSPATSTPAPTATPVPGIAASIVMSTTPSPCGGAAVAAYVTDGYGIAVPNGATVFFSTNLGSITSGTTTTGYATAQLTVPAGISGPAVVSARAGNITNQFVVPFVPCTTVTETATPVPAATATSTPAPIPGQGGADVVPQQPQQPQGRPPAGTIAPPNTGDAGLADN